MVWMSENKSDPANILLTLHEKLLLPDCLRYIELHIHRKFTGCQSQSELFQA